MLSRLHTIIVTYLPYMSLYHTHTHTVAEDKFYIFNLIVFNPGLNYIYMK
jgi:hypothetical protein